MNLAPGRRGTARLFHGRTRIEGFAMQFEAARRDTAHVQQLRCQLLQPRDLTVDDRGVLPENRLMLGQRRLRQPA